MNYCLRYSNTSKTLIKEAKEITIIYNKDDMRSLPAFIDNHSAQRVIIVIPELCADNLEIKKIQAIANQYPSGRITFCIYHLRKMAEMDTSVVEIMQSLGQPWFTGHVATTWETLQYLISLGVSDVYIGEELGFELPSVAKVCHNAGVKVRVIPNVAQSSINKTPDLKKFFIRPEDMKIYAPYIDTIEFWGELKQQDTFYKIYTSGQWYGNLKEIIFSFDLDLDSHRVLPIFGSARLDCGKRCLKGFNCSICDNIHSISKKMEAQNLIIKNRH